MKVLSGIYRKDGGTIWYKGQEVDIPNPRAGLDLGISMIHQELVLAPHLTVAQNIFMGREPRGRFAFVVDDRRQVEQTAELIERLHLRLDPRAKVKDLKVAQQQMVSIAPRTTSAVTWSTVGASMMRPRLAASATRSTFVMSTPRGLTEQT